jgi:hypothetical protein
MPRLPVEANGESQHPSKESIMARKKSPSRAKPAKKKRPIKKIGAGKKIKAGKKAVKRVTAKTARRPAKSKTRKAKTRKTTPVKRSAKKKEVLGEGNYTASRNFREKETAFVQRNKSKIPAMGKAAEKALEGPEGADLRAAEAEARSHTMPES